MAPMAYCVTYADHLPGEVVPAPIPPDDDGKWDLAMTSTVLLRSFLRSVGDEWAHQFEVRIYWTWERSP